jgi:predicted nuclease of predicted toxin-antitoxin system
MQFTRSICRNKSETDDSEIIAIALRDQRIVITRDSDFIDSFEMEKGPPGLIVISIGNCTNSELIEWLEKVRDQLFAVTAIGVMVDVQKNVLVITSHNPGP